MSCGVPPNPARASRCAARSGVQSLAVIGVRSPAHDAGPGDQRGGWANAMRPPRASTRAALTIVTYLGVGEVISGSSAIFLNATSETLHLYLNLAPIGCMSLQTPLSWVVELGQPPEITALVVSSRLFRVRRGGRDCALQSFPRLRSSSVKDDAALRLL